MCTTMLHLCVCDPGSGGSKGKKKRFRSPLLFWTRVRHYLLRVDKERRTKNDDDVEQQGEISKDCRLHTKKKREVTLFR